MMRANVIFCVLALGLAACPEDAVVVKCSTHTDCDPGSWCNRGTCEPGDPCSTDNDCSGALRCINATCVADVRDGGIVTVDAAQADSAGVDGAAGDAHQPACLLAFDPDPVEFGAVRVGVQVVRDVQVSNPGEVTLQVLQATIQNNSSLVEFSIDRGASFSSGTLAPGQSQSVRVVYTPADALPDTAQLQLVATGCPSQTLFEVDLIAEFKQSPRVAVTDGAGTSSPLLTSLDFGDVRLGQFVQRDVYVKNVQAESGLTVESASLQPTSGHGFTVNADPGLAATISQWISSCSSDSGCNQAAGESCESGACLDLSGRWIDQIHITVQLQPQALGATTAQLRIRNSDATNTPVVITLLGNGIPAHDCPARLHAPGAWDAVESRCVWTCDSGWYDLNGDLNLSTGSDGCEYECSFQPGVYDEPDLAGVDANCDGLDGVIADGWFVAASAGPGGNGSRQSPFNNLLAGINAAATDASRKRVHVSDEVYNLIDTLVVPEGVKLYGGYRVYGIAASLQWRQRNGVTTVQGTPIAIRAQNIVDATLLQLITVNAGAGTIASPSSIALHAIDAPGLVLEGVHLRASNGLDGAAGSPGSIGSTGVDGQPGKPGCEWGAGWANCREGGRGGLAVCAGGRAGSGGNGGFHIWPRNDVETIASGSDGTIDASSNRFSSASAPFVEDYTGYILRITNAASENNNGRHTITSTSSTTSVLLGNAVGLVNASNLAWTLMLQRGALTGESNAASQSGGTGGERVGGQLSPTYSICAGANGGDGAVGRYGNPGNGGTAAASGLSGTSWNLGHGLDGNAGQGDAAGGTGGGGGGGGDCEPTCFLWLEPWHVCLIEIDDRCNADSRCGATSWGGGGGGGGSAGCPGSPGLGGKAGGASIGVLAVRSPLSLIGGSIATGNGGVGGSGGDGGDGGPGGLGKVGGTPVVNGGAGGRGGDGGRGGWGGGGAGGAGGDSLGIVHTAGQAPVQSGGVSIVVGTAGSGGSGGSGADPGFCNRSNSSVCGHGQAGANGRSEQTLSL